MITSLLNFKIMLAYIIGRDAPDGVENGQQIERHREDEEEKGGKRTNDGEAS